MNFSIFDDDGTLGGGVAGGAWRTTVRAVSARGMGGNNGYVSIEMDGTGEEVALSFTLIFDPSKLVFNWGALGNLPAGTNLSFNESQKANGRVGFLIDGLSPLAVGTKAIMSIQFDYKPGANGLAEVGFASSPTPQSVSDIRGFLLQTDYVGGYVAFDVPIPPSPAPVTITPGGNSGGGSTSPPVLVTPPYVPIPPTPTYTPPPVNQPTPTQPAGASTHGGVVMPGNSPNHALDVGLGGDGTIFGFPTIYVIGAAAVALFLFSSK